MNIIKELKKLVWDLPKSNCKQNVLTSQKDKQTSNLKRIVEIEFFRKKGKGWFRCAKSRNMKKIFLRKAFLENYSIENI